MTPGPPGPITWRAYPVSFELLRAATVQGLMKNFYLVNIGNQKNLHIYVVSHACVGLVITLTRKKLHRA